MNKRTILIIVLVVVGLFLAWRLGDLAIRKAQLDDCLDFMLTCEALYYATYPDAPGPDLERYQSAKALCSRCNSLRKHVESWRLFP
jgi:hypothetical protein